MNYYERIQAAIDFAEGNLENNIAVEEIAKQAYMSVSNFYRLFFAITGFQAKEYLINRRISNAAADIRTTNMKIIDVAMKYAYDSPDAFSRTFKKLAGCTPNTYRHGSSSYTFERINVMEKYFGSSNCEESDNYPEIKVIRNREDMRVAAYCCYGRNPEDGAFAVIRRWIQANEAVFNNGGYRIFGYNAPDSDPSAEEYGYEVCVTIPEEMEVCDALIKTKVLQGGLYAIVSIDPCENLGKEIMKGWRRFSKWLEGSRYMYGKAQWLEEHLGFDNNFEHCGGIDLYMPVTPKSECSRIEMEEEDIRPFTAASYTATGKGAEQKARSYLFDWAAGQGIDLAREDTKVYATYDSERIGQPDFWYKLLITVPKGTESEDEKVVIEQLSGGRYLCRKVKYRINAQSWYEFIQNIIHSKACDFGCQPFLEEYLIDRPCIAADTDIIQHMSVKVNGI